MLAKIARFVAPAIGALVLAAAPAAGEIVRFDVALSGANQVPPAVTSGAGTLVAEFDTDTGLFSWTLTYEALTGPPTAMHFHGPAEPGFNAPVALPIDPPLDRPVIGQALLSDETAGYLLDGLIYLNVHTAAFPGGEIRGQLVPLAAAAPGG